jgi:chromobox protein 1
VDDTPEPSVKRKRNSDAPAEATWLPSKSDWEPLVEKVDTVERDATGKLSAYVLFKNGKKTRVSMEQVYIHCPRPMLTFYENHLKFK